MDPQESRIEAKKETRNPLTDAEKAELLTIINQVKKAGIKLNLVAASTSIHYQSFINKVKDLELRQAGKESTYRNNFTRRDYEAITIWLGEYKRQMFGA